MKNPIKSAAKWRLHLSTQIIQDRHEIYEALCLHEHGCLANRTALFLLKEARWDEQDFVDAYLAGDLDG